MPPMPSDADGPPDAEPSSSAEQRQQVMGRSVNWSTKIGVAFPRFSYVLVVLGVIGVVLGVIGVVRNVL
jgi:hypothetical protein